MNMEFDGLLEAVKSFVDEIARIADMFKQFTESCGDIAEQMQKRIEQLRISKAGWKNKIRLAIIHDAQSVEAVPVASSVRKNTSATGE